VLLPLIVLDTNNVKVRENTYFISAVEMCRPCLTLIILFI